MQEGLEGAQGGGGEAVFAVWSVLVGLGLGGRVGGGGGGWVRTGEGEGEGEVDVSSKVMGT